MAEPCTCRSPRYNPPSSCKDKLTGGPLRALTKGSNISTLSPAISQASTPAPTLALTPAPLSTNELFKQFMKAYLDSNQRLSQPPAERKRPLKAKVPDIYYGKLHIDWYHFC